MFRWSDVISADNGEDPATKPNAWVKVQSQVPTALFDSIKQKKSGFSQAEYEALAAGKGITGPESAMAKTIPGSPGAPASQTPAANIADAGITLAQLEQVIKSAAAAFAPKLVLSIYPCRAHQATRRWRTADGR
jgi:hypothetical protein